MNKSQNDYPELARDSKLLHTWVIPSRTGEFKLLLRNGSAGFLLAVFALWFSEVIEQCKGKVLDDWGWAPSRPIRGTTNTVSNHCSGTAMDLNATQHPLAKTGTFSPAEIKKIHRYLRFLKGSVRGGLDYSGRKDAMHWEIVQPLGYCEKVARRIARLFPRGRRILRANPSQRAVIFS